jgi:hypothetical protein
VSSCFYKNPKAIKGIRKNAHKNTFIAITFLRPNRSIKKPEISELATPSAESIENNSLDDMFCELQTRAIEEIKLLIS